MDRAGSLLGTPPAPAPKMNGAQAEGCSPVAKRICRRPRCVCRPVKPSTIAKSLAIGNPADGPYALELARAARASSVDAVR